MITHPGEVIILHFINLNSGISISVYYKQNESNQEVQLDLTSMTIGKFILTNT